MLDPLLIQENTDVMLEGHLVKASLEDKGYVVTQTNTTNASKNLTLKHAPT